MKQSTEDGSQPDRRGSPGMRRESAAFKPGNGGAHEEWLQRTIETEIVPRLMLAHRLAGVGMPVPASDALLPTEADVKSLAAMILADDCPSCAGFIETLRARGIGLEPLFLDLLAPTARLLGVMWERDQCDFTQVTLGLWRLQNLLFDLSPDLQESSSDPSVAPRRAMFASAPGSQHTLGLLMVSEFFRRAGWDVWAEQAASLDEMANVARSDWFDLIGLSASTDSHVAGVTTAIRALRKASRNPDVGVMVGGPIFLAHPELVTVVGADFTAIDARQAVDAAAVFAGRQVGRC
jgi:MerR family transcriptional regulator, light-induced transcriptional regulator